MTYTVKQLAEISGVSVRTLHWYDQKGLLNPPYRGHNGYRYYEEEQLLILQQILFFRELGFTLKDIQRYLAQRDFDKVKALQAHKKVLTEAIDRKSRLLITIDETILHLKGEKTMQDKELYYGFDISRQKEYEQYLVKEYGTKAEELLKQSHKRAAKWGTSEWDAVKQTGDRILKELADAINADLPLESDEVQTIIHSHYMLQNKFNDLTKEIYIALTDLYAQHPDFKKFFDVYHPKMIEYLSKAMRYYAEKNL